MNYSAMADSPVVMWVEVEQTFDSDGSADHCKLSKMRILVTNAESRVAYTALACLAHAGHTVFCCGDSSLSMSRFSRYVAGFHHTPDPSVAPAQYRKILAAIVRETKIEAILPTHEEVATLLQHRENFPPTLIWIAPPIENVTLGLDKGRLARLALQSGIPSPNTLVPSSFQEAQSYLEMATGAIVLKPRRGNGGQGVYIMNARQARDGFYQEYCNRYRLQVRQLPIIQDYVEGCLLGCGFLSVHGKLVVSFSERYLRSKSGGTGPSVFRKPVNEPQIESMVRTFCKATRWHGVAHMDFILTKGGGPPLLIDLTPRLWGAVGLAVENGMNFPLAALAVAIGDKDIGKHSNRPATQRTSQWIAGELMLCVENAKTRQWKKAAASLLGLWPARDKTYDDVKGHDVAPLLAELAYYATKYYQAS